MKKKVGVFLAVVVLITITGCSNVRFGGLASTQEKDSGNKTLAIDVIGNQYPYTIVDSLQNETIIQHAPQKVAVLTGSHLNIWYDLGGKSICTSRLSGNLKLLDTYKDEIIGLPTVGEVYQINSEAIVSQEPDLVITQTGVQTSVASDLKKMGLPVVNIQLKSFDDVVDTYRAFGKIQNQSALAEQKVSDLKNKREQLLSQQPSEHQTAIILYLTSKSVAVKLDNSIAGEIAQNLGIINLATDLPPDTVGSENTPLDIEYIVEKNPDYILVTSMIADNETAISTMNKLFTDNPAWKGVKAVQEGRVVYLPQEYFLYNAGPYYNEAIEYMARGVYPEIYGTLDGWYGR